jgi:hypothetical protein
MTGLWTNDRDRLDEGVCWWLSAGDSGGRAGDYLIDSGVVRVLDPNNTELRAKIRDAIADEFCRWLWDTAILEDVDRATDAVFEALRQPMPARCQHVSPSPWGPTQCALESGHADRHAYSPSEALGDHP